ncbi:LysR family transcriptional regulator, regulator for bpeEF and oprC [Pararobbsia alpina]|uniref:LysR substrate-binding domain-containing protein n=1 Tax=Pararobbsia alpina TaxID=621374 RepID=UPI0039A6EA0B
MMGRLEAIKIFLRIAETSSFTKTADSLDVPRGTVSRAVQTLEEQLGVRLFSRNTRRVSLTDAGRRYYDHCQQLVRELAELEGDLRSERSAASGLVRVDTSATLANGLIIPALNPFLERFPQIDVQLGLTDRNIDLIEEGVDCTIRAGFLEESSLIARRIGNAQVVTCASPAYLQKHGVPTVLEDLQKHLVVNYVSARTGKIVPFEFEQFDQIVKHIFRSRCAVNEGAAYVGAGVEGIGIIQPSKYLVSELISAGKLIQILPEIKSPPIPLSLIFLHRDHVTSATREFAEWVASVFQNHPDLSAP